MIKQSKLFIFWRKLRLLLVDFLVSLLGFYYIRLYFIFIAGSILFNWLVVYILNTGLSENLAVLHYNIDFGVDLIGEGRQLYTIPLLGTIFFAVNLIPLSLSYRKDKFLSHLILIATLIINIILSISLGAIYLFNF